MTYFDVFNGDADGICALRQLRLHTPRQSTLVTGLKRDIDLLSQVDAGQGDEITVLDVSLEKNRAALDRVLDVGASVFYADHHFPGEIPEHNNLEAHINIATDTCTSLIVNEYLQGAYPRWAVVGAYGDNFDQVAPKLGESFGLSGHELSELRQLGICLNYNSYGFELADLMYHPAKLYELLCSYADPIDFSRTSSDYKALLEQYQADKLLSQNVLPETVSGDSAVYMLPNEPWAKRIIGVMGNRLAKQYPDRAHALLVDMSVGYRVSVRAPYRQKTGADEVCRQFESGGGRQAAAGINQLAYDELTTFLSLFYLKFSSKSGA